MGPMGAVEMVIVLTVFLMTVALPATLIFLAVRNRRKIVVVGAIGAAPATVISLAEVTRGNQVYRQALLEFADGARRPLLIASALVGPLQPGDRGLARWADERLLAFQHELPPADIHQAD